MASLQSKILAAQKAGYSDDEIFSHISSMPEYKQKTKAAIDEGYKPSEILSYLAGSEAKKPKTDAIPAPREERSLVGQAADLYKRGMGAMGEFAQEAAGRQARSMVGGLAGAATIPEYLMSTVGLAEKGATERGLREMTGIPEGDFYFGAGKLGSEIAGTAGVGNVLAAPLRGAAVLSSPATAQALRTGAKALEQYGFGVKGLPLKKGIPLMAAGGAAPAFVTSGLMGEDTATSTAMGAALPLGGAMAGFLIRKGRDFISPQNMTLLEASGNDINALINSLRSGDVLIPGARPHAGELTAEVGNPDFSRLVASLLSDKVKRSPAQNKEIAEEAVNAAVARAMQFEAAAGSAANAERALLQGLETPGVTADDVFDSITKGARQAFEGESAQVASQASQQRAAMLAQQQQQMGQLAERAQRIKNALAGTQQQGTQNLLAQQEQARQAMLNEQMLERTSAEAARQERLNRLAMEQEQARNALLARPVEVPPPAGLAEEQARLAQLQAQRAQVGADLPKVSQMEAGKPIISASEELAKRAQEEIVAPAYQAYFKSHKGKIDFGNALQSAEKAGVDLGSLRYLENNKDAQSAINKIEEYKNKMEMYREAVSQGYKPRPPSLSLTLQDANNIEAALNFEYKMLESATDTLSNAARRQIKQVKDVVDRQIKSSISPETAELGRIAKETARTKKIEPFDEGIVGSMRQETRMGRERLLAENIGKEVLSKEQSAAEYVRAYGPDSPLAGSEQAQAANDNLKTSILDLYRREVAPEGTVDLAKHDSFLRKNEDKIAILDEAGLGIRDAIEEQKYVAGRLESEVAKTSERIAGLNKVQQEQLEALKAEQKASMQALEKAQKAEMGAEKERFGLEFKQLTDKQKASLGKTESEQKAAYKALTEKQKQKQGLISSRLEAEKAGLTRKQKLEQQFLNKKEAAEAANVTRKYAKIMNYKSPEVMRKSFLSNPDEFDQASQFLNDNTRRRVAHDIVIDIMSGGGDIAKRFNDNSRSLIRILDSVHPGKGREAFESLVGRARSLKAITDIGKQEVLRPTQPSRMTSDDVIERVKMRRSSFTAEQLNDIDALVKDMNRAKTFKDLAGIGSTEGDRVATDALERGTGSSTFLPPQLDFVVTAINNATRRLERLGNRKIAEKLVMAAINPKLMAELLESAQKWEARGKAIEKGISKVGAAAARVQPLPSRESQNRNALNQ